MVDFNNIGGYLHLNFRGLYIDIFIYNCCGMGKGSINILDLKGDDKEFLKGLLTRIFYKYPKDKKSNNIEIAYKVLTIFDILLPKKILQKQLCGLLNEIIGFNIKVENGFRKEKYIHKIDHEFKDIFYHIIIPTDGNNQFDKIILLLFSNIFMEKLNANSCPECIKKNISFFDPTGVGKSTLTQYNDKGNLETREIKYNKNDKKEDCLHYIPKNAKFLFDVDGNITKYDRCFELGDLLYHLNRKDLIKIIDDIIKQYRNDIVGKSKFIKP